MSSKSTAAIAGALAVVLIPIGAVVGFLTLLSGEDSPDLTASCGAVVVEGALPAVDGFDDVQVRNAAAIMAAAADRDLPQQAGAIGIMTAIQESGLRNLANRGEFVRPSSSRVMTAEDWAYWRQVAMLSLNYPHDGDAAGDWDSVGLFQGRPQAGWGGVGTPEEMVQNLLNPAYTAGRFFDALVQVPGWEQLEPGRAAQAVQRSAFPDAYAHHWAEAQALAAAVSGLDLTSACASDAVYAGLVTDSGWTKPVAGARYTGGFGDLRSGYTHMGSDFAAPLGSPIYAAADGLVVHTSCSGWKGRSPCNILIDHGTDTSGRRIQTLYVHMYPGNTFVSVGQSVTAGQHIANVGSYGNSTGPHLHLEVWIDGEAVDALPYLAAQGVSMP